VAARRAASRRPPRQRLHAVRSAAPLGERLATRWQRLPNWLPESAGISGGPPLRQIAAALREWLANWLPENPAISGGPPLRQIAAALRERRPAPGKRPAGRCRLVRISHAAVS